MAAPSAGAAIFCTRCDLYHVVQHEDSNIFSTSSTNVYFVGEWEMGAGDLQHRCCERMVHIA
jgi:hypothetical protein